MITAVGAIMIALNLVTLYISLRIFALWMKIPHDELSGILLWLSVALAFISAGAIFDGAVYFAGLNSRLLGVGGTFMLVGMVLFAGGTIKSRKVIYRLTGVEG